MQNKTYKILSVFNFMLGICAICLYLPYTFKSFNVKGFDWLDFAKDLFKNNYLNVLIYFGIFLLLWFIVLNLISIPYRINLPKFLLKISVVIALALPLIYVLSIKYNWALNFWIKNIAPNIKTICYVLLCSSVGCFVLGLICNFITRGKANFHHVLQAIVMCALLALIIAVNGWCGWKVDNVLKMFGVVMGLFAIYLPISSIVLIICRKSRS